MNRIVNFSYIVFQSLLNIIVIKFILRCFRFNFLKIIETLVIPKIGFNFALIIVFDILFQSHLWEYFIDKFK